MHKNTESAIEDFDIELFENLGYHYIYTYTPIIAPDKVNGNASESALEYCDTTGREHFENVRLSKLICGEVWVDYEH